MGELANCSKCDRLFVKTTSDICEQCRKEEDKLFDKVYNFIRKRENRSASVTEVTEGTGVEEDLIYKFIREGRLKLAQFPNLGYPCQQCGKTIREGKLCEDCATTLKTSLDQYERDTERKNKLREEEKANQTYYAVDKKYRDRRS